MSFPGQNAEREGKTHPQAEKEEERLKFSIECMTLNDGVVRLIGLDVKEKSRHLMSLRDLVERQQG